MNELLKHFKNPAERYYPRPLWFWNEYPTVEKLEEIMTMSKKSSKYGGFGIVGCDSSQLKYMSEDYIKFYETVLKKAKELNMKICLYDEWWFPSGNVGGELKEKYPEACAKRLDKFEYEVEKNKSISIELEKGTLMSCVAVNKRTWEIIDLSYLIVGGSLSWSTEEKDWSIMMFYCVLDGWDRVDYLEPESVKKFIELTHERYYTRFKEYFPSVIDSTFYDEPQFYSTQGRMWTTEFNEAFIKIKGYDPSPLYPALWYDIGETTAYARNELFGFRAHLYANGFPKVIQEWCTRHQIQLTGHVDNEESVNPTGITGDLMKSFKYQDIPGIDEIFERYRAAKAYKIVSSSAYNWDKPLVMSESFGGMGEGIGMNGLYKETMEQYVKGINFFVPHALWTSNEPEAVIFSPELSYRSEQYGKELGVFSDYVARLSYILQGGRHIVDIGVLYPIHSLQASYFMDWGVPYDGGPFLDGDNYQDLSLLLTDQIRKDFTFIHPEVLDERCSVCGQELVLENKVNKEQYKVIIIPSMKAISLGNLKKIYEFYSHGGHVIFTKELPLRDASGTREEDIKVLLETMFDASLTEILDVARIVKKDPVHSGSVYFLTEVTNKALSEVIDECLEIPDVRIKYQEISHGVLSYIHKERDGLDYYFVINSSDQKVSTLMEFRNKMDFRTLNPHNGDECPILFEVDQDVTRLTIHLEAVTSLILVGKRQS